MKLRTPICDLFGIEYPIFLAGMGQVAYAEVCAAVSEAGGYGTLGMVGASPEQIRAEMRKVQALTDEAVRRRPAAALPEQVMAAIDVIIEEGASAFIAGLGVPGPVIGRCHAGGVQGGLDVRQGRARARAPRTPAATSSSRRAPRPAATPARSAALALIPQIVDAVKIPVLAAGSIVDGRGFVAALALGAQGIWMGTRFIASDEARAAQQFKRAHPRVDAAPTRSSRAATRASRCASSPTRTSRSRSATRTRSSASPSSSCAAPWPG